MDRQDGRKKDTLGQRQAEGQVETGRRKDRQVMAQIGKLTDRRA